MARLQILELPEGAGDDRAPFVLVVDEYEPRRYITGPGQTEQPINEFEGVAEEIGARAVLIFAETVDIPANDVPVDENGHPLKIRIEGDFEQFHEQVEEEVQYAQGKVTRALDGQRLADEQTDIARDADRLARWRTALAEALGMDRLRDWDDIRNAAAGLRQERDAQTEELERLRAGEEPGWDYRVEPTPGQWIGRWNQASPKERLSMAGQILDGMKRANDCFLADHEAQIARLKAESSRPTHPDGTPYRHHEIKAEGWGHCDGCQTWGQWTAEKPHDCINMQAMSATPDA